MAGDRAKRQMAKMRQLGLTEQVIYGHDGGEAELTAIVDRSGPDPLMHGATAGLAVTVLVDEDAAIGVSSPGAVDKGTDRIKVAERKGATPAWRNIDRVAETGDPDLVRLELQ